MVSNREIGSLAAVVLLATACSSEGGGSQADGSGGGGGEGAATGPGPRGTLQGPPVNPVGGFTIELPAFELAPGEEKTPCWISSLDVEGPSMFINAAALRTGPGMHHGNVTTRPATASDVGIRECGPEDPGGFGGEAADILAGGAVLFGSSTQFTGEEWRRFPDGMAYRVKAGFEIVFRMHYLNTTPEPLVVQPEYEWYTIAEEDLVEELAPFAWMLTNFEIPPRTLHEEVSECVFEEPWTIVNAMPHMHALGTRFWVGHSGGPKDGEIFLESDGYDPDEGVIFQWDPGVGMSQSDGAFWGCEWDNTFDKPIVEGIGDNEMCILFGYGYPAGSAYSALAGAGAGCAAIRGPSPDGATGPQF